MITKCTRCEAAHNHTPAVDQNAKTGATRDLATVFGGSTATYHESRETPRVKKGCNCGGGNCTCQTSGQGVQKANCACNKNRF